MNHNFLADGFSFHQVLGLCWPCSVYDDLSMCQDLIQAIVALASVCALYAIALMLAGA